jgi:hypothetical protein
MPGSHERRRDTHHVATGRTDQHKVFAPKHPSRSPPRSRSRHFLTSDKRSAPRGFKQLQKRPELVTPDRKVDDCLGDGFSDLEVMPTGLPQLSIRRKSSHPAVPFPQLDLTPTTTSQQENGKDSESRKGRFMVTRKRNQDVDDPFSTADIQLTPTAKRRRQKKLSTMV